MVFLFPSEVIKLDGTTPVRYGLRLNMDEKYTGLKKQLSELCGLKPEQILLAEVHSSNIKVKRKKKVCKFLTVICVCWHVFILFDFKLCIPGM